MERSTVSTGCAVKATLALPAMAAFLQVSVDADRAAGAWEARYAMVALHRTVC